MNQSSPVADFEHITPDHVLNLVERTLRRPCSNICRPLNSYINRVYEVHLEDGSAVIAKFYRPGRWSLQALEDEHLFLREMHVADIPVVAPLVDAHRKSLFVDQHIYFALFPRMGGRICDEPTADQWNELGRLAARMHLVGDEHPPTDRIILAPDESAEENLEEILESGLVSPQQRRGYEQAARDLLQLIDPLFDDCENTRIHGDLHRQNLIHRPDEGFYIIDLDDMAWGPPVQDLWMLLPGRRKDCRREIDLYLDGYASLRDFDESSLRLIEPLRGMRFLHYTAWCAHQALDGGLARLAPGWGTDAYWQAETAELRKQHQEIIDDTGPFA